MKELLARIPLTPPEQDTWQGHALPPAYQAIHPESGSVWFLDGGNASILEAPHFSFQKLRTAAVHYPDKLVERRECFALIHRNGSHWSIEGGVSGQTEGELEDAITVARTLLEHALALEIHERTRDLVVLDGDNPVEGCASLQKSITILTEKGYPLSAAMRKQGPWSAQLGIVTAVKLHERSRHVFLAYNLTEDQLAILAHWSTDVLFPGYPGGLVLADKLARVSQDEQASLRVQARSLMKDLAQQVALGNAEAASDSHTILDTM